MAWGSKSSVTNSLLLLTMGTVCLPPTGHAFSALSHFQGSIVAERQSTMPAAMLTMRKQKASDRRTRRMQRGEDAVIEPPTLTSSPMALAAWQHKRLTKKTETAPQTGGRGRSRNRSNLYNTLSSYHGNFLSLLTAEYRAEEEEVVSRINASADDPLGLEAAGYALFDLYPERRGNLFSDEVYRLAKAGDACTTYSQRDDKEQFGLPLNHKFSSNDVMVLTLQPRGSGDFFGPSSLPTNSFAASVEARVLNTGPTYVDIALPGGAFEATFGPAPNDVGGKGDRRMRLRADLFFSNIPYTRMVDALSQITSIPDRKKKQPEGPTQTDLNSNAHDNICLDEVLRDAILSTYTLDDASSPLFRDTDACDLREMAKILAKPPLQTSFKMTKQALTHIHSNPYGLFPSFNGPQLTAIESALTRRLTLIQGPPGTGKTTVASSIAFGFVHQCRNISPNTKVLACAFSNVGADNLAEQIVRLGLKVVRIGKASAVTESLWHCTLDAAIDRDPAARKAQKDAAWATSQLATSKSRYKGESRNKSSILSERSKRDVATAAVKASIDACNVAATKALREADVIVTTSIGASDPRLLAACGIVAADDDKTFPRSRSQPSNVISMDTRQTRVNAPDNLPPLSLPFVIVDEACQSVEPATLIPLMSTNSCRSLVLLGDPCQLPPTIRTSASSPLSVSLMERLATVLPQPVIVTGHADHSEKDETFLDSKPTRQALSLFRERNNSKQPNASYRKRFEGSLLLSVQYRMHPSISAFSSALFYDGLLSSPSFLAKTRVFPDTLRKQLPSDNSTVGVRFIHVAGRCNERRGIPSAYRTAKTDFVPFSDGSDEPTSYWNEEEAVHVVSLIKNMLREHDSDGAPYPTSIGVVTPYNGQVELIKSLMAKDDDFKSLSTRLSSGIEVKSVDGYQGRERDVIIFSAVRSNRQGKVGFLRDWRRMNVALTRARSALIVVGDLDTLTEGDKHWAAFGAWCKGMKCIISWNSSSEEETPPLS